MKALKRILGFAALGVLACTLPLSCVKPDPTVNKLVILHTNDTHSQIEPNGSDLGGVMRRMAIIDSIRDAYSNVMLVDAGDAVQGTLYFYLYGGAVEQEILNLMGLDEGILGNHEFDNGMDSLAEILRLRNRKILCSNYITDGTPLDTLTTPYSVREFNGHRIGFIGINLDPNGIISDNNWRGLGFQPIIASANAAAGELRAQHGVDAVVAITHIGYTPAGLVGDSALAVNSRGIDIIIGGHSHTVIDPSTPEGAARSRHHNLDGKEVLVVQTGKSGINLGMIEINLDSIGTASPRYSLIPVDNRWDGRVRPDLQAIIDRYKPGVDSLMALWVGTTATAMPDSSVRLLNFFSDFVLDRGKELAPDVDLAIANKGGLRASLPEGRFSKGMIINMLPFRNFVTVVDVKGSDLLDIFKVMARTRGNGVSGNVRASYAWNGDHNILVEARIDGRPINPERIYRVATIDYLANGGDYMDGFRRGTTVASSPLWVYDDLLNYITDGPFAGKPVDGQPEARWIRLHREVAE